MGLYLGLCCSKSVAVNGLAALWPAYSHCAACYSSLAFCESSGHKGLSLIAGSAISVIWSMGGLGM